MENSKCRLRRFVGRGLDPAAEASRKVLRGRAGGPLSLRLRRIQLPW